MCGIPTGVCLEQEGKAEEERIWVRAYKLNATPPLCSDHRKGTGRMGWMEAWTDGWSGSLALLGRAPVCPPPGSPPVISSRVRSAPGLLPSRVRSAPVLSLLVCAPRRVLLLPVCAPRHVFPFLVCAPRHILSLRLLLCAPRQAQQPSVPLSPVRSAPGLSAPALRTPICEHDRAAYLVAP